MHGVARCGTVGPGAARQGKARRKGEGNLSFPFGATVRRKHRRTRPTEYDGLSRTEVAKRLGCSRENVRLIEKRALIKLRAIIEYVQWYEGLKG